MPGDAYGAPVDVLIEVEDKLCKEACIEDGGFGVLKSFNPTDKIRPMREQIAVATQVMCQPPTLAASIATAGGPKNCPIDEHCCIQPTVVDTVCSFGAASTTTENRVPGMSPPMAENRTTARYLKPGKPSVKELKARKVVTIMPR